MVREGAIYLVGIFCDGCGRQEPGDVLASSQAAAEDGLREQLVAEKGWRCDGSGDWCPRSGCQAAAAVKAGPAAASTEAPALPRVGPPEVEALRAIDRIIGNRAHLGPTTLGQVRGLVLDALNAWHSAHRDDEPAPDEELDPGAVAAVAEEGDRLWR